MSSRQYNSGSDPPAYGRRLRVAAAILLMVAAVTVIVIRANRGGLVYYVTVSELVSDTAEVRREGVRVAGRVVPGTVRRDALELTFEITDGNAAVPVHYRGVVPDTFGEDGEVVAEGTYTPAGQFEAFFLLNKCPSRYEEAVPQEREPRHPDSVPRTKYGGG